MKKTAVLLYDSFCNFEFSAALELLALGGKPITVFARSKAPVRSEEGLRVLPDAALDELDLAEYDSLLLTGAADIREAIEDEAVLAFIRRFDGLTIGAISIAPLLLVRAGLLGGKPFMVGADRAGLLAAGFTEEELRYMVDWNDNLAHPVPEGYLITDRIVTSVSYNFVRWALAFGKLLGIDRPAQTFGL